jgi:hypothetical protein
MPKYKVFYFSHAPENVYAIIREELAPELELVTLCDDSERVIPWPQCQMWS